MFSYFKQPYPSKYTPLAMLRMAITFGLAVGLFLFIFKPFGIGSISKISPAITGIVFGGVTFLLLCLNALIVHFFKSFFNEDNWTIGREIVWMGWSFLAIAILNYYTGVLIFHYQSSVAGLVEMLWQTIVVGFIPFMVLTFFRQMRLLKQHLEEAKKMNRKLHQPHQIEVQHEAIVHIESENEREEGIQLNPQDLLYIESSDNYIEVFWMENEIVRKAILRSTLKRIEEKFENHPSFFRCHRAFIINPNRIAEVEGNSQGYRVLLHETLKPIPVSRGKQADFKQIYSLA